MTRASLSLDLADARRIIAAGELKAIEMGIPYNIAVTDAGGGLVAHTRMDDQARWRGYRRCRREWRKCRPRHRGRACGRLGLYWTMRVALLPGMTRVSQRLPAGACRASPPFIP